MLELNEPIDVLVFFQSKFIKPHLFFWRGRKIKIEEINLVHTSKNGESLFYHFSVSSSGNLYKLRFDAKNMKWYLEGVQEDS